MDNSEFDNFEIVIYADITVHCSYYFEIQRNFSTDGNCEKVVYTHVLSRGKTEEKHYGEYSLFMFVFMPPPFSMGVHIVLPLSVRPSSPSVLSVLYVTKMVSIQYLLKRLVYWIQILYTDILIHRYIIIKCRSSLI